MSWIGEGERAFLVRFDVPEKVANVGTPPHAAWVPY